MHSKKDTFSLNELLGSNSIYDENKYRIKNIEVSPSGFGSLQSFEEDSPKNALIKSELYSARNDGEQNYFVINLILDSTWLVDIIYLENYKDTCFAEQKTYSGEIKIGDYDIKNLTEQDLIRITGKNSFKVLKSQLDTARTGLRFVGDSKWIITLQYSFCSLKTIDSSGAVNEVKIPLTCYGTWATEYGDDWSILFLNNKETTFFEYSNDIERDKLYGYFSIASFEEKVTNFNALFRNNTGDGCMVIFENKEVKGDVVYQFAHQMSESLYLPAVVEGFLLLSFCEIYSGDNRVVYSYFFYLDSNSDTPFLSTSGAEDSEDNDSALENGMENIGEKVDETAKSFWESDVGVAIKYILIGFLGILALAVLIKILAKLM